MMKRIQTLLLLPLLSLGLLASVMAQPEFAFAANASDWKAGNIIDDTVFTDKNAMSVEEIQAFLNSKVGTGGYDSVPGQCDTSGSRSAAPFAGGTRAQYAASLGRPTTFTCLTNYYEVPKTSPGPGTPANNYGGKPIPAGARSAAQLIWDAAQANGISPKVLLVKIQKESAGPLTTDDWPFEKQYTYAMGAYCPDGPNGAECDPDYAGFSIQIHESAALLRYYLNNMEQPWWDNKRPFQVNSIRWNTRYSTYVNGSGQEIQCGAGDIFIENRATAALYTYTPYQPNQAALNYMYGSVPSGNGFDSRCAAYGNRNFWRIFTDWFGTTRSSGRWLRQSETTGKVYLVAEGYESGTWRREKFHIPSWEIIEAYALQYEPVIKVSEDYLSDFIDEGNLTTRATSSSYPHIQFMDKGNRYFIADEGTCIAWGFNCFNTAETKSIPGNSFLERLPGLGQLPKALVKNGVAYRLENGKKLPVLDGRTFNDLGLRWDNIVYEALNINSQQPLGPLQISHQVAIQFTPTSPVVLYSPTSFTFHAVPNYEVFSAWGMQRHAILNPPSSSFTQSPPSATLPDLTIWAWDGSSKQYIVDSGRKIDVTGNTELPSVAWLDIAKNLLPGLSSSSLGTSVQTKSGGVHILEDGQKRYVPSYNNFTGLGLSIPTITHISDYTGSLIPTGANKLAEGSLFETSTGVYVVNTGNKLHIPQYDYFASFALDPSTRITGQENLNTAYPGSGTLSTFIKSTSEEKSIVLDNGKRVTATDSILQDWGLTSQTFQSLAPTITTRIRSIGALDRFIIFNNSIHYADGGCKHHILSYGTYQSLGGKPSNTYTLPYQVTFDAIPTCAPIP